MEVRTFENLTYVIKYPENYVEGKAYPVIFLFHGAGGRGNDINMVKTNPYFNITQKHENFPFISVAPQCSANTWFDIYETLKRFILRVYKSDFTDKKRVYMMGASMGGYATWQLAMSMPEIFAAIVPICGGGMYWNADRLLNVPVWAFHGGKDDVVYCEESKKMVDAVNKAGGRARLTVYPECEHGSWIDTYANYEVFEWLLSNAKSDTAVGHDKYDNSEMYG